MRIDWAFGERGKAGRAVTVGNFDGVHLGHRRVLGRLVETARARDLMSTVLLFDPHPLAVLAPERCPARLTTIPCRVELLRRVGIEAVGVIAFDRDAATVTAEAFVSDVLCDALGTRLLMAAKDFRFGAGRRGDLCLLRRIGVACGIEVEEIPAERDGEEPISSSRIRKMVGAGDVAGAARLLGRPHVVTGVVERGSARGRALGFPTANLGAGDAMVPGEGIYGAWARWGGAPRAAAVHVGRRLTFDDVFTVEAHVLDTDEDLYGRTMEIGFVERLRDDVRFGSADDLARQIARDVERVRALGAPPPATDAFPCGESPASGLAAGAS